MFDLISKRHDLFLGDCLDILTAFPDNSVDAIVTDCPYGLKFMGKKWDYAVPSAEVWAECLRVLKHGGHLLCFGGTRTYHRVVCNIEDGGFEIRDTVAWVHGQGFPKSLNVGMFVDKLRGNERKTIENCGKPSGLHRGKIADYSPKNPDDFTPKLTIGSSEWEGWGTALKPAFEPICLARKPLSEKNVALNCLKWGTGGLNIDGCKIGTEKINCHNAPKGTFAGGEAGRGSDTESYKDHDGRFPSNFIHDGSDEVVELFPETKSIRSERGKVEIFKKEKSWIGKSTERGHNDSGSAARFFYCAKASKKDRDEGCEGLAFVKFVIPNTWLREDVLCKDVSMALVRSLQKAISESMVKWSTDESGVSIMGMCPTVFLSTTLMGIRKITPSEILNLLPHNIIKGFMEDVSCRTGNGGSLADVVVESSGLNRSITDEEMESVRGVSLVVSQMLLEISKEENWSPCRNTHSTVKPTTLMRYLCRLITPPNGIILDPFMGSGSTGKAAALEGFRFVGIDLDPHWLDIAEARIQFALNSAKNEDE